VSAFNAETMLGLAAVGLAVLVSAPQLAKLLRSGDVSGVSVSALSNSTISFAAWTAYAIVLGDVWLFVSSAIGLPGMLATLCLAWRRGAARSMLWLPMLWLLLLAAIACSDVLLGTCLIPPVIGASVLWFVLPAGIDAWRSPDVSGIAPGAWWAVATEGAIFVAYGIAAGVAATVLYGTLCLVGAVGVLSRLLVVAVVTSPSQPRTAHQRRPRHGVTMSLLGTSG